MEPTLARPQAPLPLSSSGFISRLQLGEEAERPVEQDEMQQYIRAAPAVSSCGRGEVGARYSPLS